MNLNKRKFWLFGLLLPSLFLAATAPALAQEPEEKAVVTLGNNGGTVTWSKFVEAINNPSSVQGTVDENSDVYKTWDDANKAYNAAVEAAKENPVKTAKKAYDDADNNIKLWNAQVSANTIELNNLLQGNKVPKAWLKTTVSGYQAFNNAYNNYLETETDTSDVKVWVATKKTGVLKILYISFIDHPEDGNSWYSNTAKDVYKLYTNAFPVDNGGGPINKVYLYLGEGYTASDDHYLKASNRDALDMISCLESNLNSIANNPNYLEFENQTRIDEINKENATFQANLKTYTEKDGDGKTGLDKLYDKWQEAIEAEELVATTKKELDDAKAAYDKAVEEASAGVLANYKDVTLTADVTATEVIKNFDGTINGAGYVITLDGNTQTLFDSFKGSLINVALNGKLANAVGGAFNSVAIWNGNNSSYYDAEGTRTACNNLGQLGFVANSSFGVDFSANKLVKLADNTKVYSVTVYDGTKTQTSKYVQKNGESLIDETGKNLLSDNMLAKTEDTDLKDVANVFYEDKTNNTFVSEKIVISDRKAFYAPVDIEAKSVTYDRKFTEGQNAVCLPFELKYDKEDKDGIISVLSTYDRETTEKFYFKKVGSSIPANTPFLMVVTADLTLNNLSNVKIVKTPEDQKPFINSKDEQSTCFGLFKPMTRDEFKGTEDADYKVYAYSTSGSFAAVGDNVKIPAFRCVIWSELASKAGPQARKIAIVDEKGVEITDELTSGIDTPKAEAAALEITTAPGQIIISSEADLDQVAVHAIDGKVAAIVNVKAGDAATVDVQPGIYVVMGKKVMVK